MYIFRVMRGPFKEEFYQCVTFGAYTARWQEQLYSTISLLLMYVIPLVTMVTAYLLIFSTIARKSRDFLQEGELEEIVIREVKVKKLAYLIAQASFTSVPFLSISFHFPPSTEVLTARTFPLQLPQRFPTRYKAFTDRRGYLIMNGGPASSKLSLLYSTINNIMYAVKKRHFSCTGLLQLRVLTYLKQDSIHSGIIRTSCMIFVHN